ncbi:lipoprotein signal peptidase [Bizionia gelidisalsuginis]|uniref:Lipoprotein signal peptidase n=2 Tax=Bizionia TaxID=283785 RepID=A0A8H2QJL4_9FLAO|nr:MULTISPECIES: lipoprotein signal peptidase [Bizionia]TYB76005.1 lipoprotein signal peptidase [Bizionia saleffrena]TYC13508.1 lipoprotein signal peptidase [Bizionia gelidisalsuginis]
MTLKKASFLIIIILIIDQISKVYIKTHFQLGESVAVFDKFRIYFIENDGMAWGTKLSDIFPFISDRVAKLSLTLFRIAAIFGIGYWLISTLKKEGSRVLIIALAFIFSGALGNIIDSVFYGVFFDNSYAQVATFLPQAGGYDSLFHGKVVDMLYFPLWKGYLPEWIPGYGGEFFTFFEPVFNIADVAISIGFVLLIFFNKQAFPKPETV